MKGLGQLVKNELIKLSHQTSFRVISVIVLILCIASPAISIGINKLFGIAADLDDPASYADLFREMADEYTESDTYSVISKSYYNAYADSYSFFADNGITDWRYRYFFAEHLNYTEITAGLKLINEGLPAEDVTAVFTALYELNEAENDDEVIFTNIQSTIVTYTSMLSELEDAARAAVVEDIFKNALTTITSQISALKSTVKDAEAALEESPSSLELQYELKYAEATLSAYQSLADAYKHLRDTVTDYEDWRVTLVFNGLEAAYLELPEQIAVPEAIFDNSEELNYTYDSYESYTLDIEREHEQQCKAIRLMEHSLYHNIPTPQAMKLSPKLTWQTSLTSFMGTLGILLVILAGSSVASEFSQGTIRLLLIRPRKRRKILASKLLALTAVMAIYMLAAYVLTFAVSMLLGGMSDMIAPDLFDLGGKVTEITPFVSTAARMLICSITPLVLMLLAFMLSAITRKTALSVALPLVYSQMISGIILGIGSVFSMFFEPIKYTPLLYTDMSSFNTYFLSQYITGSSFSSVLQTIATSVGIISDRIFIVGLLYNLAAAAIITVISFAVFDRKEIK